jgi:hypothetical protein
VRTRLFICVIERRGSGFNYAEVVNRHCVIVPTPLMTAEGNIFNWWWEEAK